MEKATIIAIVNINIFNMKKPLNVRSKILQSQASKSSFTKIKYGYKRVKSFY